MQTVVSLILIAHSVSIYADTNEESTATNAVNIINFGAVGDYFTCFDSEDPDRRLDTCVNQSATINDVAIANAIKEAVESIPPKKLIFPAGSYRITRPIVIPSSLEVVGEGWVDIVLTSADLGNQIIKINDDSKNISLANINLYGVLGVSTGIEIGERSNRISITDVTIKSVLNGIVVGRMDGFGGYDLVLDNVLVTGAHTGYRFERMTTIEARNLKAANCLRGLYLDTVIYSSFSGYVDGIDPIWDTPDSGLVGVGIDIRSSSSIRLHIGMERIVGMALASSGSSGEANIFINASGIEEQFLPRKHGRHHDYFPDDTTQAYFSLSNSAWVLSGIGWNFDATNWEAVDGVHTSRLIWLSPSSFLKIVGGYVNKEDPNGVFPTLEGESNPSSRFNIEFVRKFGNL